MKHFPDINEIKLLEKNSQKNGSGIVFEELLGIWKFKYVWGKEADEIKNIPSSILQVLSARLELKSKNKEDQINYEIKNSINFGLLNITFIGSAELKGIRPLLAFYFEELKISISSFLIFNKALKKYGGIILGGDCSKGNEKMISITAFGIQGELELRRNACKPGDIILTTGIHGLSKLGFLIQNKINFDNEFFLNERLIIKSIEHFCRPRVYPNFLNNLLKTRSNKNIRRIGCTDSSDGLFQALQDLAIASKCKAIINYEKIPKDKDWPEGDKWDEYYFFGGEDYELVFSLPKQWAKNLSKRIKNINEIGFFADGEPSIEFKDNKKNKLLKNTPFKHF